MRAQCSSDVSLKICQILSHRHINTQIKDSNGKKAEEYSSKRNDKRFKYLRPPSRKRHKSRSEQQSSKVQEKDKSSAAIANEAKHTQEAGKEASSSLPSKPPREPLEERDLASLLCYVLKKEDGYFVQDVKTTISDTPSVVQHSKDDGNSLSPQTEEAETEDDDVDVQEEEDI